METTCQWTKNQTFMARAFTVSMAGQIEMSGMQFIGWDAGRGKIRSWVFESDGGFGEPTWTQKDNRWIINAVGTLPDGRKATEINLVRFVILLRTIARGEFRIVAISKQFVLQIVATSDPALLRGEAKPVGTTTKTW